MCDFNGVQCYNNFCYQVGKYIDKRRELKMKYSIEGDTLPVVICELEQGEVMVSENGDRSWMLGDIVTETTTGGGAKKC